MKLIFSGRSWDDYLYWQTISPEKLPRINELMADTMRHPFHGLGKPEPLKRDMSGWWSRRLSEEHRLVYRVSSKGDEQAIEIASCRFHYKR